METYFVGCTHDECLADRDYALSMADGFMVGYVIQLAAEANNQTEHTN